MHFNKIVIKHVAYLIKMQILDVHVIALNDSDKDVTSL